MPRRLRGLRSPPVAPQLSDAQLEPRNGRDLYLARIAKPRLPKALVGHRHLRKLSCIAANNTAVYWALNSLGATTLLISLMDGFGASRHAVHLTGARLNSCVTSRHFATGELLP